MRINIPHFTIEWCGNHTANVTDWQGNMDVFTFAWEKNNPTQFDFINATMNWLAD